MPEAYEIPSVSKPDFLLPAIAPTKELFPSSIDSKSVVELNNKFNCKNYKPVPVVVSRGSGVYCWNPEGKKFMDMAAAQGALNFGHCHPRIISEVMHQMQTITIASRAFHSDVQAQFLKEVCEHFGYERCLPQNSGAEAAEAAIKLCRKWGYKMKHIPDGQGLIVVCRRGFMGRTLGAISASTDPDMYRGCAPLMQGFLHIDFNDVAQLKEAVKNPNVSAFYVEPVQGEAGCFVPTPGYFKEVSEICKRHNVLFVADEVQTGMGRTGKDLSVWHDDVRPDVVVLGKSISGGVMPVSCVLADTAVMDAIGNNEHGSTFGGCALGCRAGIASIRLLRELNLSENAMKRGLQLRNRLLEFQQKFSFVIDVRGIGLLCAFELEKSFPISAWQICLRMRDRGVLAKQTHVTSIRLCPPCIITEEQLNGALDIIESVLEEASSNSDVFPVSETVIS